ncbi:MAG TPA: DUF5719 family protein [Aeromicrobium sp.]|nr:DUF5719 family protein [Aeromicrobium sp.]
MRSSTVRAWGNLALPAAAVGLVLIAALIPNQRVDRPTSGDVPVTQRTFACPASGQTHLAVGQLVAGTSRVVDLLSKDGVTPADDLTEATRWQTRRLGSPGAIVTQDGAGSGAEGYVVSRAGKSAGEGLSVAACGSVIDEAWFLGLGTADRRSSTLVLANLADTPAVADVRLWNRAGEVDAVNASGISVEPRSIVRIPVSDLAAGEPDLAAQVLRRRGVLTAMVEDSSTATFAGTELISPIDEPSRDQVVAGIDGQLRGKTLLVLNPGDQNARVDVTAYTADGPVADAGLQDLKVAAGRYRVIAIPDGVGAGPQTLRITSDRDVVAAARVSPDVADYLVAESAPLLDGPAIVPVDLGRDRGAWKLILSAVDDDVAVEVVGYDDRMRPIGRTTVPVVARTTVGITAADIDTDGDLAYLTVSGDGPVVGAVTYSLRDLVSSLMLRSASVTVDAPVVLPD